MKDADARERVALLEEALEALPQIVANKVMKQLEPALVEMKKSVADVQELIDVLESDHNAMRVDVNAVANASATVANAVEKVNDRVTALIDGLTRIGSTV